jgi:hypothetical protein
MPFVMAALYGSPQRVNHLDALQAALIHGVTHPPQSQSSDDE